MDSTRFELLQELDLLDRTAAAASVEFLEQYETEVESYRTLISEALADILGRLSRNTSEISAGNPLCEQLAAQAVEYVDWLQWCLWDLPYFAVAQQPSPEDFGQAVAACGLVYLSARVFDDVIDGHFWYKGKHPSLLSVVSETSPGTRSAEGLTILAGLLILIEGLSSLADSTNKALEGMLQPILASIRHAVIGLIMEQSAPEHWDPAYYDRLVRLKNVDYWRCLYTAMDPGATSPLYPFLVRYYTLAQYLNDVQDFDEDMVRGQPNLLSLQLPAHDDEAALRGRPGIAPGRAVTAEVETFLANTFLELGRMAQDLPRIERLIAQLKLGESLREALRFGLFASPVPQPSSAAGTPPATMGLHWFSELDEVLERAGSQSLVSTGCPVCRSPERNFLFRKQGFAFHRCHECSHIYVMPRISAELQASIGAEWDSEDADNAYLKLQRMYAAATCELLRSRAPGNLLLDIGFGSGHLLDLAKAYGFEVFGVESSQAKVQGLHLRFGRHVHHLSVGQGDIPWHSFDVVVMSHILEHLPDPADSLDKIRWIMNPHALLYVAVPDMDSLPFKVFGKKWDVINPLIHPQYFCPQSLLRLLRDCGFVNPIRIQQPELPTRLSSRWARLLTRLSGTDSSELVIVAQVPPE